MASVAGGELQRKVGRAAEQRVGRQGVPGPGGWLGKGGGERFTDQQTLVGIGHALIVTFGQAEAARLVKIVLRRAKLLQIGAGLDHSAVGADRAGDEKEKDGGLLSIFEDGSAIRSEVVG